MTIQNYDLGSVALDNVVYESDEITLAGADTLLEGTILARLGTGKLGIYDDNGAPPLDVPVAVLREELVVTGAGDYAVRPIIAGNVRADRLVIDDGGTVTQAVKDQLRGISIIPIDTKDLSQLDNQ